MEFWHEQNRDLLSQWRGYADNGRGVTIGFDYNTLQEYVKQNFGILELKKVVYISEEDRQKLVTEKAKELLHLMYMILEAMEREKSFMKLKIILKIIYLKIFITISCRQ